MNDRERAIGARVRQFREDINWPQPDFAEALKVSRHQLANVEYGRAPLRVGFAVNICEVFGANGEWLATGHGLMHGGNPMLTAVKFGPEWYSQLLSDAYDQTPDIFIPPSPVPTYLASEPTPDFDPQSFLIKEMLRWFQLNKFKNPLEAENFCREICGYAETYLDQLRRMGTAIRSIRSKAKVHLSSKDIIDQKPETSILAGVRAEKPKVPTWPELKNQIIQLTAKRGEKIALANHLKVSRQVLGNWLSDDSQGSPSATLTLKLLQWVEEQNQSK